MSFSPIVTHNNELPDNDSEMIMHHNPSEIIRQNMPAESASSELVQRAMTPVIGGSYS